MKATDLARKESEKIEIEEGQKKRVSSPNDDGDDDDSSSNTERLREHNWAQLLTTNVPFGASLEGEIWTS